MDSWRFKEVRGRGGGLARNQARGVVFLREGGFIRPMHTMSVWCVSAKSGKYREF